MENNHNHIVSVAETWEIPDQLTSQKYLWNGNVYFVERGSDPMSQNFLAKDIKKLNVETGQLDTLTDFAEPVQLAGFAEMNHGLIIGIYRDNQCELVYSDGEYAIGFNTIPVEFNLMQKKVNVFCHYNDVYVLWQEEGSDGVNLHCQIYNDDDRKLKEDKIVTDFDHVADIEPSFIEDTLYLKCIFSYEPYKFRMLKMENNEITELDNGEEVTNLIPLKDGYLTEKKDGCYFGDEKCGNYLDCPEDGIYLPQMDIYFGSYHSSENDIALFWEDDASVKIQYIGTDDIDGLANDFHDQNVSYTADENFVYGVYTRNENVVIQKLEVRDEK